MTLIQARVSERVGTIAFDNYAKRNAFTTGLIEEVIAALDQFEAQGVRVVVFRSATNQGRLVSRP